MTTSSVSPLVTTLLVVFVVAILLVFAGLVFYALWRKGDVRAEFCYGSTKFRLEADDRRLGNNSSIGQPDEGERDRASI